MTRDKIASFVVRSALGWLAGGVMGIILAGILSLFLSGILPPAILVLVAGVPGMAAGCGIGGAITTQALSLIYPISERDQNSIVSGWAAAGGIGAIAGTIVIAIAGDRAYAAIETFEWPVIFGALVFSIIGAVGGGIAAKVFSRPDAFFSRERRVAGVSRREQILITLGWAIGGGIGGAAAVGLVVGLGNQIPMDGITSLGWGCFMCCLLPGGPLAGIPIAGAIGSAIMASQLLRGAPSADAADSPGDDAIAVSQ